jgi:DNA-binding CsgD family transcriptional regulator
MIPARPQALTIREMEIFQLLGKGKTSKEIATILHVSVGTVANHRKSLCRKLAVHSTAELIRTATLDVDRR